MRHRPGIPQCRNKNTQDFPHIDSVTKKRMVQDCFESNWMMDKDQGVYIYNLVGFCSFCQFAEAKTCLTYPLQNKVSMFPSHVGALNLQLVTFICHGGLRLTNATRRTLSSHLKFNTLAPEKLPKPKGKSDRLPSIHFQR